MRPSTIPPAKNPYARLERPLASKYEPLLPAPRMVMESAALHRLRVWMLTVEDAS